jgi:hypothetical protein
MKSRLLPFLLSTLAATCLTQCATDDVSQTREMLSKAGFRQILPETPRQKELYAAAPSYQVHSITSNGKTFYAYKDERNGTAYVGDQITFRQYQRLLLEQSAAEKEFEATPMVGPAAIGWYGAYSPFVYGPRIGGYRFYR